MSRLVMTGACLVALVCPSSAGAAQRYAGPEGKGPEPCEKAAPCSLKDAITKANTGDEVIVLAGTYGVSQNLYPPESKSNVYVHGDFSGPMPVISSALSGGVISLFAPKDRLSYLDVSNTGTTNGSAISCSFSGEIDRVRATAVGEQANGIEVAGACAIRDSVAIATGKSAAGLRARGLAGDQTTVLRNVTAMASGPESSGIKAEFPSTPGTYYVDAVNTIAAGTLADVAAYEGTMGAPRVVMSYSNYDLAVVGPEKRGEVVEGAGNQKGAPSFVNSAVGDYREAAGSPTIDAGSNDQLGPLDLAGTARILGSAPDIGAYEFVPVAGELQSLALAPKKFRAGSVAGAVASGKKKKKPAPRGTTVSYGLSAPATVEFHVELAGTGRKVGKGCVKQTHANRGHRKCTLYKPLKGRFSVEGATGANSFGFSGRIGGKSLKPGSYRLVGSAGTAIRRAPFRIVK